MNKAADLLNELRIDRSAPAPASSRRGLGLTLGIGAAVLAIPIAIGAWALVGRDNAVEVQTAQVVAIGGGSGNEIQFGSSAATIEYGQPGIIRCSSRPRP